MPINFKSHYEKIKKEKLCLMPLCGVEAFVKYCKDRGIIVYGGAFNFETGSQYLYTD